MDGIIIGRFEDVIAKGEAILNKKIERNDRVDWVEPEALAGWLSQSLALLLTVFGPEHAYSKNFIEGTDRKNHTYKGSDAVRVGVGILKAANEDYGNGFVWTLKERVHAEIFDDYFEMAVSLLSDGYKDAAAVIAGSTLEGHLRALSTKVGLPTTDGSGRPLKAATLNAELKRQGTFNNIESSQITAWLAIRNDAAHANYAKYDATKVQLMIDGIRPFMLQHPA
jgi:hypothetical protein